MTNNRMAFAFAALMATALPGSFAFAPAAQAQAVIASVNDDPVTNIDVEQHTRILRVLKRPATHDAALESIYETRLKLIETAKYKVNPADQDIGWALSQTAKALKVEPQQLLQALQRAGVSDDQWKQRWKAEAAWLLYIRALNRTLEIGENEVRAELARQGKAQSAEYVLRQVIMVVPNGASGPVLQARFGEAQALRNKFNDCATGLDIARGTRDTAVRESITRSSSALTDEVRKMVEKTPVGKLTQPGRGQQGIEMIAVCSKINREDSAAAESVRGDLLMTKLQGESQRRFQEVRARAIIVRK